MIWIRNRDLDWKLGLGIEIGDLDMGSGLNFGIKNGRLYLGIWVEDRIGIEIRTGIEIGI